MSEEIPSETVFDFYIAQPCEEVSQKFREPIKSWIQTGSRLLDTLVRTLNETGNFALGIFLISLEYSLRSQEGIPNSLPFPSPFIQCINIQFKGKFFSLYLDNKNVEYILLRSITEIIPQHCPIRFFWRGGGKKNKKEKKRNRVERRRKISDKPISMLVNRKCNETKRKINGETVERRGETKPCWMRSVSAAILIKELRV